MSGQKVLHRDGPWTIEDTSMNRGLYRYSLYHKGKWNQSSASMDCLLETIDQVDSINAFQDKLYQNHK